MECGTISRLLTVMMAGVTAAVTHQLVMYAHYFAASENYRRSPASWSSLVASKLLTEIWSEERRCVTRKSC